jgi:hypothetical protein
LTYDKVYKKQHGKCAVCRKSFKSLHVDHCHSKNILRGLLCGNCNRGLGMFKDSPRILRNAIRYLRKER